ncbi:hypothetical protein N8T08_008602 [Aspergillus melleus]|uniref:Uncharacterized protein n=1 Tax=Aspergillus melleus TaxID=138277 RepID=A0ACC3BEE0_9EURO|nr:hypothetical protein N8T08_008602 [Aspergillus melleus]
MEVMEQALAQLPDPPKWSLKEELIAPPDKTRLSEAELSFPICAAIQVGLVSLLSEAGIIFHTVVGHGGEIGAAYAVGKISAEDAVKIAYYRGIACRLVIGLDGARGAMIAVGFGYVEGLDFCSSAQMKCRLTVAASNSPKSVTLPGDEDAVFEAKKMLDDRGLFNRVLKVGKTNSVTAWVSSVYDDSGTITDALEAAVDDGRGALNLILEVGPHPALRGPTLKTLRTKIGYEIPYSGVLDRKADDITALSNALGLQMPLRPTTRECLDMAIDLVKPGALRDFGKVIEKHANSRNCGVHATWGGHGINTEFHPPPWIPHYGKSKVPGVCKPGMTFTIEPILTLGKPREIYWPDDWTNVTVDGKRTAQFEHTLLVTETGVEVLTARLKYSPGGPIPIPTPDKGNGA